MATIDAAKQAGHARFHPILLTSITTVAGLLPLMLDKSLQAQILIPLAASLAFGLVTATVAALFLVRTIDVILDDFGAFGTLEGEADDPPAVGPATTGPVGQSAHRPRRRSFGVNPIDPSRSRYQRAGFAQKSASSTAVEFVPLDIDGTLDQSTATLQVVST